MSQDGVAGFFETLEVTGAAHLALDVIQPEQLLLRLNDRTGSFKIRVATGTVQLEIGVSNGFVMSASAGPTEHTAQEALERFLKLEAGRAEIVSESFLANANLFCPIQRVLGHKGAYVTATLRVDPAAFAGLRRGELLDASPPDPEEDRAVRRIDSTIPIETVPDPEPTNLRRRPWLLWGCAFAIVVGAALGLVSSLDAASLPPDALPSEGRLGLPRAAPMETTTKDANSTIPEPALEQARVEATHRQVIAQLVADGHAREALRRAGEAVELSPGLPERHLALGDARAANGRAAAALRAYRRALRLGAATEDVPRPLRARLR